MSSSSSSLEEVISESSLNGHHNTGESKNQFHPLTHQVAGHVFGHNKNKLSNMLLSMMVSFITLLIRQNI